MAVTAGTNIAVKVPTYRYAETVAFYRDAVGLELLESGPETSRFAFGAFTLWLDCVDTATHSEVWLELTSDRLDETASDLVSRGAHRRDEIEPLGESPGCWISDPAGTILLLSTGTDS